jgi:hypothetical protein
VLTAPITTLLVVAGFVFLLIAVVGNVAGKIEPGDTGRVASGVIGTVLLISGLGLTAVRMDDDRGERDAREIRPAAGAEARKLEAERGRQAEAEAGAKVRQAADDEARRIAEEKQRLAEAAATAKARREALEAAARRDAAPGTVVMPNVVGMQMGEADSLLGRAGLTHRGSRPEVNHSVRPGTVVRQAPVAGQRVLIDTPVTLVFASEWNRRVAVRPISSDGEARGICPAACGRANGKWTGKWFSDTRGGGEPRFYCGCAV